MENFFPIITPLWKLYINDLRVAILAQQLFRWNGAMKYIFDVSFLLDRHAAYKGEVLKKKKRNATKNKWKGLHASIGL